MAFELAPIGGVNYGALGQTGTPLTNSWLSGQQAGVGSGFSLAPQNPISFPTVLQSSPTVAPVAAAPTGWSPGDASAPIPPVRPADLGSTPSAAAASPTTQTPGSTTPQTNLGPSTPLDWNVGTMQLGLSGIQTLGNLWTSWNAIDLAKKNYNMQHNLSQANLDNQVQTTNNALEDKINSRYVTEGKSSADASNYLSSHELKKTII